MRGSVPGFGKKGEIPRGCGFDSMRRALADRFSSFSSGVSGYSPAAESMAPCRPWAERSAMPICWKPRYFLDEQPSQEDLLDEATTFAARLREPRPRLVRPQLTVRSSASPSLATRSLAREIRSRLKIAA
jgi:hypothetical protein